MKFTEKLSLWGVAHAAARNAERAVAQQTGEPSGKLQLHREARILRERANRLHREVYMELGENGVRDAAAWKADTHRSRL